MESISSLRNYLHVLFIYNLIGNYDITDIHSLDSLKRFLQEEIFKSNNYYRGQPAKYKFIECGLSRENGFVLNESEMYSETLKTRWQDFINIVKPIEHLTKMQHYGMPTRLVDFSVNPLIALFFAVIDDDRNEDSVVYVYSEKVIKPDASGVEILSLLPQIKDKNIIEIREHIEKNGIDEMMDDDQLLSTISSIQFMKYSTLLTNNNPRLVKQDGTFAICGNCVKDGNITNQIKQIDPATSTVAILVPYQFKRTIKDELDKFFGINVSFVYPELNSWSEYIRKKYKSTLFNAEDTYSLLDKSDISISGVKRLEVKIVLNRKLKLEEIKKSVCDGIEGFKDKYDIIWFYVATDGESYSTNNWILSGQWISPRINEAYSKYPLYLNDQDGMCWDSNEFFSERKAFDRANRFRDGKYLLASYQYVLKMLFPEFQTLESAFEELEYDSFTAEVFNHTYYIRKMCGLMADFGITTNSGLQTFFYNYKDFAIYLSNITYWVKLKDEPDNWLSYRISDCFNTIRKALSIIEKEREEWLTFYDIKLKDLDNYDFSDERSQEKSFFRQNIPVSKNAIDVYFKPTFVIEQKKLRINCDTNLFDHAKLLISFCLGSGKLLISNVVELINGNFSFLMDFDTTQYRDYLIRITLFFPLKEPSAFINCAGKEYEHITGKWVKHAGINSTLEYVCNISIDRERIHVTEPSVRVGQKEPLGVRQKEPIRVGRNQSQSKEPNLPRFISLSELQEVQFNLFPIRASVALS